MSSRRGREFDHKRMDEDWYDNLNDPVTLGRFVRLLIDYAEHLRAHREQDKCDMTEQEQEGAVKFAQLIDNPVTWPQAQQYIPQLRVKEIPEDLHCKLLSTIFSVVRHRIEPPKSAAPPSTPERSDIKGGQEEPGLKISGWMRGAATPIDHVAKKRPSISFDTQQAEEAFPEYDDFGALLEKSNMRSSITNTGLGHKPKADRDT